MRRTALTEDALCRAVAEMDKGLVDADLGGGVVKKRVALPGRGKRGSTRTMIATNKADRWVFLFGFEKSARANVGAGELAALQHIAADLLRLGASELDALVDCGALEEICDEHQD